MNKASIVSIALGAVALGVPVESDAHEVAADSVMQHARGNRLSVGGYGEVAYGRNFYSDPLWRNANGSKIPKETLTRAGKNP